MNTVQILITKRLFWKPTATRSLHAWRPPKRFRASGRVVRARFRRPVRAAARLLRSRWVIFSRW